MRSNLSVINVYNKKNIKSKVATQLLYGDSFKILKQTKSWLKIKNDLDNYKGYITNKKFTPNQKSTHKIYKLEANLYSKPNIKYRINRKLSFGSRIKIIGKKNNFYKFDNYWIKKKDLKTANYKTKDNFKYIKKFINTKYKWGGKHFKGIDCSSLVQLCLNFNNKFCPRDSKDQIKYFKKKTKLKKIKKGDLIFWKGHVAVVISKHKLIHAYGPEKKTLTMPINRTIDKIQKTTELKVTGVRRIA